MVFSDGVTETANEQDELYGEERLEEFLVKHRDLSAEDLRERLLEALADFRRCRPPFDDTTFVIVKRL